MMADTLSQWRSQGPRPDLWVFAYASLVWRPEFEAAEQRPARVQGDHRCLEMWSRVNRGTYECPGLVFRGIMEFLDFQDIAHTTV